jgi:hypothetical protein
MSNSIRNSNGQRPTGALLTIVAAALILTGAGGGWVVPPDASLSPEQYRMLGVPVDNDPWSGEEHAEALAVLAGIDRAQLPRYGSTRSGKIFEQLVSSQDVFIRSIWTGAYLGDDTFETSKDVPTAPRVYAWDHDDRFLFDRELLEIHAAILRLRVDELESLAEQDMTLAGLVEQVETEAQDRRVSGLRESRQQLRDDLGKLTIYSVATLIQLAEMDATRQETRRALCDRLSEMVPRAAAYLSQNRVDAVAHALRKIAAMKVNAAIQSDLTVLANSIATASQ